MKRFGTMVLATILALTAAGCGAEGGSDEPISETRTAQAMKITPEQARERMDSGEEPTIVDVRTQEEYDAGHIPGAILIPNESIGSEPPAGLPDKDAEILVYCRSGRRSAEAAEKLAAMGYTAVYDFGGILDWPYETVVES